MKGERVAAAAQVPGNPRTAAVLGILSACQKEIVELVVEGLGRAR
jgi:hypothetical protein